MPAVQYPDLSQMYGPYSVNPTLIGNQREDTANQNNAINQASDLQSMFEKQAKLPGELANQQALGDYHRASAEQMRAAMGDKANAAQIKQFQDLGSSLESIGAMAKANGGTVPLALQASLPKELQAVLSQPGGAEQLHAMGRAFRESSMKWQAQLSKQGSAEDVAGAKVDASKYAADQALAGRKYAADKNLERARVLLNKPVNKTDKISLENYAAELEKHADALALDGNMDASNVMRRNAARILEQAKALRAAGAAEAASLPRDLVGKPKLNNAQPAAAPSQAPLEDPLGIRGK